MKGGKMTAYSWRERYLESLKEYLTIEGIKKLCNVSTCEAVNIRKKSVDYLKSQSNDPNFEEPKQKVDIEAIFAVTGHDSDYYYKKMIAERKAEV